MKGDLIFQRTEAGRHEIRAKQRGLTQSERQVLILIDGVTSYDGLGQKLTRLNPQRLDQILRKLAQQGFILELLLPSETVVEETFEPAVVDRFLQQDPLDPITIIALDQDSDTDIGPHSVPGSAPPAPAIDLNSWVARVVEPPVEAVAGADAVDFYLPLPEAAAEDPARPDEEGAVSAPRAPKAQQTSNPRPVRLASERLTWHAWVIALGLLLILASILIRVLPR